MAQLKLRLIATARIQLRIPGTTVVSVQCYVLLPITSSEWLEVIQIKFDLGDNTPVLVDFIISSSICVCLGVLSA